MKKVFSPSPDPSPTFPNFFESFTRDGQQLAGSGSNELAIRTGAKRPGRTPTGNGDSFPTRGRPLRERGGGFRAAAGGKRERSGCSLFPSRLLLRSARGRQAMALQRQGWRETRRPPKERLFSLVPSAAVKNRDGLSASRPWLHKTLATSGHRSRKIRRIYENSKSPEINLLMVEPSRARGRRRRPLPEKLSSSPASARSAPGRARSLPAPAGPRTDSDPRRCPAPAAPSGSPPA